MTIMYHGRVSHHFHDTRFKSQKYEKVANTLISYKTDIDNYYFVAILLIIVIIFIVPRTIWQVGYIHRFSP